MKSYEKVFTSIGTVYDPENPLSSPVIILLENNGIRLRFDGPEQRLRLIEVLDFQKCRMTYNNGELVRGSSGPAFKSIYSKLFGPTYPGEYIESQGLYVLSYPGVAFSFPIDKSAWKEDVSFESLLSSSNAKPAVSMAIFYGPSWPVVRDDLFTRPTQPRNGASARFSPANDEVELIEIHDSAIEIIRRHNPPFRITLHSTTPQDLVAELGPPDVIYRKNDHRLSIHRARGGRGQSQNGDVDDTEEDTPSDDDDSDLSDLAVSSNSDCFYNYFDQGFDVYISAARSSSHPVATKIIIHGNVPGSFNFQRYRRCRWVVELPPTAKSPLELKIDSEQPFQQVLVQLRERFGGGDKPMPLSRGNDSPSSSCELLGGWEDGDTGGLQSPDYETSFGNTGRLQDTPESQYRLLLETPELYGFPGFVFEVLKNQSVSGLTVF